MTAGSFFSGLGLMDEAAKWAGLDIKFIVEKELYFHHHLRHKHPKAIIYDNLLNYEPKTFGYADLFYGGDPCQPHSFAGAQKGQQDDRYVWPHFVAAIHANKPTWIVNENVLGSLFDGAVYNKLYDLEAMGYECQTLCLTAYSGGALHEREQVFILAYSTGKYSINVPPDIDIARVVEGVQNQVHKKIKERGCVRAELSGNIDCQLRSFPDRSIFTVADDVTHELVQLQGFGNGVVPTVVYPIFRFIKEIHEAYTCDTKQPTFI